MLLSLHVSVTKPAPKKFKFNMKRSVKYKLFAQLTYPDFLTGFFLFSELIGIL